ncbi:hypothetical protein NKJ88_28495 [Mesorhizobium sp. M0016]|uniref:hypothetical protein n=1 Tax=Mesorhizobium sp. M0016 TaxID=2956843 RepID=UPI003335017E
MLEGASKIFVTGSFWYGSAAMAAGLKTLEILRTTDALAHMGPWVRGFAKVLPPPRNDMDSV